MKKLPPGALAGLTGATTNAAAQFLLVLIVTRSLPPETAGKFFTATALALMLAGILRLDTGNALIYFRARQAEPPSDDPDGHTNDPGNRARTQDNVRCFGVVPPTHPLFPFGAPPRPRRYA
ncbi:hypothetical protein ABGB08_54200, partial [Acrocarpospora sp. B8E8]